MTTEEKPMDVFTLLKQFALIESAAQSAMARVKEGCEIMDRQTKQLEIALDAMIAVCEDDTAELRIRRKLSWALQQIKGLAVS